LTIMKGEFELAVRKTRSTVEYQKIIKDQIIILDELTTIVKYLLSLTRSETTGGNPQFVIMDLNDVIADIKNTWEPEVGKKGGILSVKTVPSVSARLEPVLFKRIIANLIENALRHIPENNGRIDLTLFRVPQAIRISVADNGCGIPPDQRRTLFDRFFSNAYKNSSPDSIGLGLGLCRWIAEIHEGHITLDEKYRGGARFVITIPAA